MTSGRVLIHLISPEIISQEVALACLSDEEKSRANHFRFQKDARLWIACRANLRKILGRAIHCPPHELPLVLSEYGKPELAPPYHSLSFNLSHCADLAILALSVDGPVGVDLEPHEHAPDLLDSEAAFCHPEEIIALPRDRAPRASRLLQIWTAKEAILKAIGIGFSHPPEAIRIHFQGASGLAISDSPLPGIENQRLHELNHPALVRHQAVVSAPQSASQIEILG